MRRQRTMFHTKEQETSEKELNKTGTSHLPGEDFKVNVIKMLTKLKRRTDEHSKYINKEK